MLVLACSAFGLLTYAQLVRPNMLAASYNDRLAAAAGDLQHCFRQLAATQNQKLYETPDLAIDDKRQQLDTIRRTLGACGRSLESFTAAAQSLPQLRFSGYTDTYQAAVAHQRHALDIAGQSRDVLRQHGRTVAYMDEHLTVLPPFLEYTTAVNSLPDLTVLAGRTPQLAAQAVQLHGIADRASQATPAAGMENLAQPTAAMFDQAADGLDYLASGYRLADDGRIAVGFGLLEGAVATYDNSVAAMSFDLFLSAPSNAQVSELPDKLADFMHAASE